MPRPRTLLPCRLLACAAALCAPLSAQTLHAPPRTISNEKDGTLRDAALMEPLLLLAQGSRLAALDLHTGQRIPDWEFEYPAPLVAVEYDPQQFLLVTATEERLYVYNLLESFTPRIWNLPAGQKALTDVKLLPGQPSVPTSARIALLSLDRLRTIRAVNGQLFESSARGVPLDAAGQPALSAMLRLCVHASPSGALHALVCGNLTRYPARGLEGLASYTILDAGGNGPQVQPANWLYDPVQSFGCPSGGDAVCKSSAHQVQCISSGGQEHLYLACGAEAGASGQARALLLHLTCVDLDQPPALVQRMPFPASLPDEQLPGAWNLVTDAARTKLYVATSNMLHRFDLGSLAWEASTFAEFSDAGERDLVCWEPASSPACVISASRAGDDYELHAVRTSAGALNEIWRKPWIASCDGAVIVPEWRALYLPTFGGLLRYDSSNLARPFVAADTPGGKRHYEPSGDNTEHVAFLEVDASHGYVVTVRGGGGFESWEVDAADKNPAPPVAHVRNPPNSDPTQPPSVYANGIETWTKSGQRWVLHDVTDRSTTPHTWWLQAWKHRGPDDFGSAPRSVSVAHPAIGTGLAVLCGVHQHFAFVGGQGLLFVADLDPLVAGQAPLVTDVVPLPSPSFSCTGIDSNGTHLYVGVRDSDGPNRLLTYVFDASHGKVGGAGHEVLNRLLGYRIEGRLRICAPTQRLYAAGGFGQLFEFDLAVPGAPSWLSTWKGSDSGEGQDCRIFLAGTSPRVLFAENNEAFAILDPDDGL